MLIFNILNVIGKLISVSKLFMVNKSVGQFYNKESLVFKCEYAEQADNASRGLFHIAIQHKDLHSIQ